MENNVGSMPIYEADSSTASMTTASHGETVSNEHIKDALWLYVSPFLLLLGLVGNIFCLIVLNNKRMTQSSCSFTLSALACVDIGVLYVGLLRSWISGLVGLDIRSTSTAMCKIHTYLSYVFRHLSSWILLLLAAERLIVVYAPLKAKRWCSMRRTWWGLICIAGFVILVNSPFLYFKELQPHSEIENKTACHYREGLPYNVHNYVWWSDFTMLCCIPFTVICFCNVLIVAKLRCARPDDPTRGASLRRHSRSSGQAGSLTFMLLLVCLVFLLTTMPISFYFLMGHDFWDRTQKAPIVYAVCNLIYYANCVSNFFLYSLGGSQFRTVALAIFCGRCCHRRDGGRNVNNAEGVAMVSDRNQP